MRHYLRQCLHSVYGSTLPDASLEVWVVDNASTDGSAAMVRQHFPQAHLIANSGNPGFAAANNQALRQCQGDYVLLLNPDTIVEEGTLQQCLDFFSTTQRCGALGVRMVNGDGIFLKESKRGFPTPEASFFKLSGLIHLLPHHPRVAKYYMGNLPDSATTPVDILPGAFIMLRREALDKVGLLDESYFMYGEDIDFSWRVRLAGYDNYYLATSRILHYKGESTRKGSLDYVRTFYNAMAIFVRHYFGGAHTRLYLLLMQCAIWCRGALAMLARLVRALALPAADAALSFASFFAVKSLWASCVNNCVDFYPPSYTTHVLPLYAIIMVLVTALGGGYDKPVRGARIAKGMLLGACALLLFYSLLDTSMRYSRAVVLFGALLTVAMALLLRLLLGLLGRKGFDTPNRRRKHVAIVGNDNDYTSTRRLLADLGITAKQTTHIAATDLATAQLGSYDAVVFCTGSIAVSLMLDATERCHASAPHTTFYTAPAYDTLLIGPAQTLHPDELYNTVAYRIDTASSRRNKRLVDIATALLALLCSPLLWPLQHHRGTYFMHCLAVLSGSRSWVGYSAPHHSAPLPQIRRGILGTHHQLPHIPNPDRQRLDQLYAQDYSTTTDLAILLKNITNL